LQNPLFQPECAWRPDPISSLPSWADASRVAFDIETRDPQLKKLGPGVRRDGYIIGYSFAIEDGPAHYVPFRHEGGDNLDAATAIDYLRQQAKVFKGTLVGANLQYDLDYSAEEGIVFRDAAWFRDIQVAEPLIDENHFSYSLDAIAKRRGMAGKYEDTLDDAADAYRINAKSEMYQLPARYVGQYAIVDTRLPLDILRRQERDIEEQDLWEVFNLESRLLPVLVKMRRRGVRIDFSQLEKVEQWAMEEGHKQLAFVKDETGVDIGIGNVMVARALEMALVKIGVTVPRTEKTNQPSIKGDFLDSVKHPVADALKRARKVDKLRTTFAASIRRHAVGDRVHCTFNQLRTVRSEGDEKGARYGRLSSTDPNLQQQPARDDFAPMWRSIYIPEEGKLWGSCDYSQQEPRMSVHYSEKARCQGATKAGDKYRNDPTTDNHTMMARLIYGYSDSESPTKKHRSHAKNIFLGLCYGMGGAKLAKSLGMATKFITLKSGAMVEVAGDEAQTVLDTFNRQVPFVSQLAKMCENKAKRTGYLKTLSGRRCRFPWLEEEKKYDYVFKALNRLIQGSSADQTKHAMVEADAAGFRLQLQIHDEIALSVENREEGEALGKLMCECVKLNVPSKVDVEIGPSWGEAK